MKKKKAIYLLGGIFLLFFAWRLVVLISQAGPQATPGPNRPPVAVNLDSVRYLPIQEIRQFNGSVEPRYQYVLAPKVSGRVIQIRKRIGDWVKKSEVVARLDAAEYEQAVLEAEANLKIARASLAEAQSQFELAEQELKRVQSLNAKGIASPSELDAAQTNFSAQESRINLAQAQVEQREAALTSAKIRLSYTILSASMPGFIGERFVDEGALLAPNSPVASVIGIDTVIIRTTIIERDYGRLEIGQAAAIEVDAYPGKNFAGRVSRVAAMLKETSRVAQVEIEATNDSLFLKPGMFARIKIVLAQKDLAQTVPSSALVNRNGASGVFTIQSGEKIVHWIPVQPGIVTETVTEIISPGLTGQVVTLGQHLLEDGSPVILPTAKSDKN